MAIRNFGFDELQSARVLAQNFEMRAPQKELMDHSLLPQFSSDVVKMQRYDNSTLVALYTICRHNLAHYHQVV